MWHAHVEQGGTFEALRLEQLKEDVAQYYGDRNCFTPNLERVFYQNQSERQSISRMSQKGIANFTEECDERISEIIRENTAEAEHRRQRNSDYYASIRL